ncbi:acetyl/propionyl/methylcrotonyl-CoA carboxylase subunit alpha [Corynebacterium uterequi]|uniref:Biotin carboxyl carrier protein/biotin carboxylase n=1 Tax=Corynebacterium uterequi TaxID=1072256 RepID=A0A0G3HAX2_9CORY|nr:biotin carboxylase N-terminal domain-containing protein [Corynebacterium uterequi]AKK10499.1 biotin carboxyl carrier protein/biotin carboxylase [Corynebacterium uterequi]
MTTQVSPITKILVANRGEIALRIMRTARDLGIDTVAVYAGSDADAPFVNYADEAFHLPGDLPGRAYLDVDAIIALAQRCGADAIHPGYGFLSENADAARRVADAGLIWIGPTPEAIAALGDKVTARRVAASVDAPMAPGSSTSSTDADTALAFADAHGLPIAIKAAYGGGGRGMKVAHSREEIPELFASAVREATAAFGRGDCFVERYLDRARHVEAQVLADTHGNVAVVGTRDCTIQRRFQKLVEEAPAPFLTDAQRDRIHASARDICRAAGYVGAGTVEYLVTPDGLVSFLEVNTRLQVEHPVTEETTGLDLVAEQIRIAEGRTLDLPDTPATRGHSLEFRINGEDPALGFLPAPGQVTHYHEPAGPGVRVDSGVRPGSTVDGNFDSLLAKLIITGATREQAIARARRALAEFRIEGLPTVVDFHRALLDDPAFLNGATHTRWLDDDWDNTLTAYTGDDTADSADSAPWRERFVAEIDGRRVEVALPAGFGLATTRPASRRRPRATAVAHSDDVTSPMQATIVACHVTEGSTVTEGETLLVLEAMKMETPVVAHKTGTVTNLDAAPGSQVSKNQRLLTIADNA